MSCAILKRSGCTIVTAAALVIIVFNSASAAEHVILDEPPSDQPVLDPHAAPLVAFGEYDLCIEGSTVCGLCGRNPTQPLQVRPGDEVWLVSSRHRDCPRGHDVCMHRFDCGVGFVPSSCDEYFSTADPNVTVTMYVHGNRVDAQTACDRGCDIYSHLGRTAAVDHRIRHVIWSWPSSAIPGPVRDARVKAAKTYLHSYILANFIRQHDSHTNVSLIGFSYGGRIIIGAQHLLGGGELFGWRLEEGSYECGPRTRVAVWAPAIPADWLHPEGTNGRALAMVDRMLLYFNTRDPLLRFYRKKLGESHTDALGYRGIGRQYLGDYAMVFEQHNAAKLVGNQHKWISYMTSPELISQTIRFSLWYEWQ